MFFHSLPYFLIVFADMCSGFSWICNIFSSFPQWPFLMTPEDGHNSRLSVAEISRTWMASRTLTWMSSRAEKCWAGFGYTMHDQHKSPIIV